MHKLKKDIFLIFIVFITLNSSWGQTSHSFRELTFGDFERSGSMVDGLYQLKDGEIIVAQYKTSSFPFSRNKSQFAFEIVDNLTLSRPNFVNFKGDNKKTELVDYTILGNSILALSYRKSLSNSGFFYHLINPKIYQKTNYGFPIYDFGNIVKIQDFSRISLISSQNKEYAALIYFPLTKAKDPSLLTYAVFHADSVEPLMNYFELPYSSQNYQPLDFTIINKEKQLLLTGHYFLGDALSKRNVRIDESYFEKLELTVFYQKEITTTPIYSEGLYFINAYTTQEEDCLTISGFFSTHEEGLIEGAYLIKISFSGEIILQEFNYFPTSLQLEINDFKQNIGPSTSFSNSVVASYSILDFKKINDDYVLIAEYNALERQVGSSGMAGSISSIDNLNFWSGDIIVTKFDEYGKVSWCNSIQKTQRTVNDGGYYLSTAIYVDSNHIHLFFNDNARNYSSVDNVFFYKGERPRQMSLNRNYVLGHVNIKLASGAVERSILLEKDLSRTLISPQLFVEDHQRGWLIFLAKNGKQHKLGRVEFE